MPHGRWTRRASIALILASATLLLSGCSFHDAEKHLRFGWPTGVTKQAESMRVLWSWAGVAALSLGVVVWGLIFWACLRYRKKDDELPRQTKYNLIIELICIVVPVLVLVPLFWRTVVVEDKVNHLSKTPNVLVQVDAFKWNWQFEYRAIDGQTTDTVYPGKQNKVNGLNNSLYLSTTGSNSEVPVLVIPVGRTIQIIEHSQDVIHSFWVPEFLFKRDVIPYGTEAQQAKSGLADNRFEFTPTTLGSYVGRCAELCGTYHSQMNFEVRIVTQQVFTKYLAALKQIGPDDPARQAKALLEAGVPGGGYATTTHPFNTDRNHKSASGS